jgi:hypothetical protein
MNDVFCFCVRMTMLTHINHHAGAAPAQKGMKTGRRKIARLLVKYA